ncbi:unnamed protein product [Auanema sp. JU1783]|nr:unnamed protein product [Auanema sp. JU1783]
MSYPYGGYPNQMVPMPNQSMYPVPSVYPQPQTTIIQAPPPVFPMVRPTVIIEENCYPHYYHHGYHDYGYYHHHHHGYHHHHHCD